ncbi:hypothetical protein FEM48_Zijuj01G0086300 [Ziziphus jujuba var. spinosa]|uniref:Uncharacterized protein n=1 Tax=Ziziphus jujuba var. spinosa TaxID=714518 RepID=A0A978W085_ZIZJJ|nr:hypothetical protein FEM48_Zijuj01G0086300 [Ziziphus jujuba var. spinosa]
MMNSNLQFLRRTLQVAISVSLLSLFLCYSSGISLFPHSFSVYFSTCLFSIFTRSLERKYMFLVCNGILAFLAKSSVSSTSSSTFVGESELTVDRVPASNISAFEEEEEEEDEDEDEDEDEEQELEYQGNESLYASDNHDEVKTEALKAEHEGNEEEGSWSLSMKQENEEDEMEGIETGNEGVVASTDELNKKFEEFIRKMKEEIRIEAQQQLIAV